MSEFDIGILQNPSTYLGSLEGSDLSDLYKFNLITPGTFSVSLSRLNTNADVFLLNANQQIIQSFSGISSTENLINLENLPADTYSLQITSNAQSTDYRLGINYTSPSTPPTQVDPLTGFPVITPTTNTQFESGVFTVGASGKVSIDYLFDGGFYAGDLAIFSLKGMDTFQTGSTAFIQEAARRALTNSPEGYTVIADPLEGAFFNGILGTETQNWNSGTYQGIKAFSMRPGDQFGVMLVPRNSVQRLFQEPTLSGNRQPLFSMVTADPTDRFAPGQIAALSENQAGFAIEDLSINAGADRDYNDVVFSIQGATANVVNVGEVMNPSKDWRGSQLGQSLLNHLNAVDMTPPLITADLVNDTGLSNTDNITSEPAISGQITDASSIFSLRVRLENTLPGTYIDAIDFIKSDGSFSFNRQQLETIYGASLPDGNHSLYLQAIDQNGLISNPFHLSFTLDTTDPEISLKAPLSGANHSPTARLVGAVTDINGLASNIQYNLDAQPLSQIALNETGLFDAQISSTPLTLGLHNISLQVSDKAGNQTQTNVNFNVTNNFNIGPTGTQGWGIASNDYIFLNEQNSLYTEALIPIELGQTQGTRKLQFEINPNFDSTATTSVIEDIFQVFLVDPTNPNQTLLEASKNQALFSLAGSTSEYTPGLVHYNGSIVEIDLSHLSEETNGLLVFKLLNSDTDTGTSIEIKNLTNTVDPEGIPSPIFPERIEQATVGPAFDISNLNPTQNIEIILSGITLDTTTGLYKANLSVRNNTATSLSRNIAVTFPEIPAGIQLQNSSGISSNGIPYINLKSAIQAGGLAAGALSESVEIIFSNPNFQLFPITATVLVGEANEAPNFPTIAPLSVTPGGYLEIPLTATDANGDPITFSVQSDGLLPTGKLSDNKLIFTPTPDEIGTYSVTLVASDGDLQTQQTVTLNVIADPITTTRISGVVLSTDGTPLAGVPIELSRLSTITAAYGSFTLELPSSLVPTEPFNIEIPQGDPYFDPYNTGTQYISFRRARYDTSTGTSTNNPRRHPNLVSGFLDGNIVYGSDEQRAMALRTLDGTGKLKTSPGNLLPFNNANYFPNGPLQNDNSSTTDPGQLFVAGDVRASENVALASLHTIFLREHNQLAEQIKQAHPEFTDEQIYQQARRTVIAEIQHITYTEYLPLLLGQNALTPYTGYDPTIDPMATPFFATAAFRLGHSQMVSQLLRLDANNHPIPAGHLSLREGFFTTTPIIDQGIEPFLRGLVAQQAQDVDTKVIDELRNFLFGPPGSGGMDLPAMNIQRSRDLGLPSYTQARLDFGLSPITDFHQITGNIEVQNALRSVYGTVDKIDPWVGGLAEDHVPGAMIGPLFQAVMKNEFLRLRDGDRFWYENEQFTQTELASIRSTTLADVIERNTDITNLPDNVFTTGLIPNSPMMGGTAATNSPTEVRSLDGSGNNPNNPFYGQTGQNLRIDYTLDYGDDISAPNGEDRPNVREISNEIFAQTGNLPNTVGATGMAIFWGQIISHDISLTPTGTTNTLKVYADNAPTSEKYPFVAETLPLLLGHNVYEGVNNVISRPIYLPAIDVANGKTINPAEDIVVTTDAIAGASVRVAASTLKDRQGNLFTGQLSITEVPTALTPATLPENIAPDLVVTIQPAEMVFTTPAPLTLPNQAGYAADSVMDLWSINPITGFFDKVGEGKVSADGSIIETISGGIRNSSWHFFAPPPPQIEDPNDNPRNFDNACHECKATADFTSKVELDSGAVIETHQLVSYQSKGVSRGITLNYDSLRADARPILHFGYRQIQSNPDQRLVASLKVKRGEFEYQLPGIAAGEWGLNGGEHVWSIPESGRSIDAALQIDMRSLPTGLYEYGLNSGIYQFTGTRFAGSSNSNSGKILNVNSIHSAFGSGWGLAGLQELIENPDGSVLLVDGDGSEMLFKANGNSYMAPPGDFSGLERVNGKFRRTLKDQTVYDFNAQNQLEFVTDRNGNRTSYVYNSQGRLNKIIDPVGLETLLTHTGNKITAITDPANRTTQLEYDNAGNLIKIINPDNTIRTWEYDTNHHIIAEIDQRNHREQTLYDFAGRAKTAIRKDGSKIEVAPIAVQGLYRPELTTNPFNAPVAFALPEELETATADSNGNVLSQILDRAGQVISAQDGSGNLPAVKRNELNLITEHTNGRQQTTHYEYDPITGNLLSIKDSLSGEATPQIPPTENQALFISGTDYEIPSGVVSVAVADIDEDSKPDIITANSYSNSITILSGNGDGTFTNTIPPISVGSSPVQVAVADINLDQHLDIVTANQSSNDVSILLGNGDGTFVVTNTSTQISPVAVAVSDVNNDGRQDIVTANRISFDTSNLSVLLGLPDGTFANPQDYSVAIPVISSLAIEDINQDDRPDVVAVGFGTAYGFEQDYYSVLLGDENGIFNTPTDYEIAFSSDFVALSDLDADGNLDVVTANSYEDTVSVIKGNGDGTFEPAIEDYQVEPNRPMSLALDDVNGDGKTDIVVGYQYGSDASVLLASENGAFVRSEDVSTEYESASVALADLDFDGDQDLVVGSGYSHVSVRLNTSNDSTGTGGTGERRYTYDPVFNEITSETDELGRQTLYEIDPFTGNRLSETRVVGDVGGTDDVITQYTYTNSGLIETMTDPLGRVTDYDYEPVTENLIRVTYAVGTVDEAIQQFEYDAAGNQTAVVDENGHRTEFEYDAMGRLVQTTYAVGTVDEAVQQFEYDAVGNQTAVVDENGHRTEYMYDVMSRLVKTVEADPDGTGPQTQPVSVYEYDLDGNQVKMIDPLGRITQSRYDSRHRLIETIKPDGWSQKMRYDFDNHPTSSFDGNGNRTNRVFDARGRLIREIDPFQQVTTFEYDSANQMIAQIDATGHKKEFKYDNLGRQIATINAPNTPISSTSYTEYDPVGNVIAAIDGEGHKTQYRYDYRNRPTQVIDALEFPTLTKYDKIGNITEVTDALQNTTTFVYDARNRLKGETNQFGKTRSFTYDPVGNKITLIDRNNRQINFIYDNLNRPIQENWLDGVGNVTRSIHSTYDAAGQLIQLSDPNSTYKFGYDLLGRQITVDNTGTPNIPNVLLNYTYDAQGNVISVKDTITGQEKATTAYIYDELNRVKQISQTGNGVANKRVNFDYNAIGQYQSIERYADLNSSELVVDSNYNYDAKGRLNHLTHQNSTPLAFYNFNYDQADRVNQIVDIDGTTNYTHNPTHQLTVANHSDLDNPDESYSYDANGNRMSSHQHGSGYVTGENNRLLSDGIYNYEYDDEGNLTSRTEISSNQVIEYRWDYRNRLLEVSDKDAVGNLRQTVTFTYDGMGRRIAKSVNGAVTNFVYDHENILLEFGPGGLEQRYLHGTGIDQVLAQENAQGNVVWSLTDHLGTVRDLVNNNGEVVNHFSYDSFGNVVSQNNETFKSRYGLTGREFDSEIGLYYYRARYYDGQVGRFISEDPIGFNGGDKNLYRYVKNSPLNTTDPLGLYGKVQTQTRIINYRIGNQTRSTTNPKEITEAAEQNPSTVSITFDLTQANIDFSPISTGQDTRKENRQYIPGMLGTDHQGHIVAKQLGGNSALRNFFAQNGWVNSNAFSPWYEFEQVVNEELMVLNPNNQCLPKQSLFYQVFLDYAQPNPPRLRPTSISAEATFLPMGETNSIVGVPNPEIQFSPTFDGKPPWPVE